MGEIGFIAAWGPGFKSCETELLSRALGENYSWFFFRFRWLSTLLDLSPSHSGLYSVSSTSPPPVWAPTVSFSQGHLSVYASSSGVIWGHLKILNFRASAKASFRNKTPSQVLGCISGGTTEDFPPIQPNLYVIFIILWVKSALIFAMKIFQISILHGTSLNYNFLRTAAKDETRLWFR